MKGTQFEQKYLQQMYRSLYRIANEYQTLRQLENGQYGLDYIESLEMAYENIIEDAKKGIKGIRRKVIFPSLTPAKK